ncbi:hypothetical protein [Undibacterium pigrum]|uniref:Phage replication protein O n=1 Tax=Undibacterium pigrum TaxID=401470 RepID=A0A318ILB1_9BURK|nr:hypothetical protein [Undibacterium pigrum]PXX33936.1 hypothetical protein DFR42_12715 [Undibacterium pigrum]
MARSRNIKPGFFTNDALAELPALGRLLFAGLWTIVDREGRVEDRIKKIKAEVLPYDDCDIDALLESLHERGFIQRYTVDGNRYIQICKWSVHQNPHFKENESCIPSPVEPRINAGSGTGMSAILTRTSPADSLNLIPDSLDLIPDSLTPDTAAPCHESDDKKTPPVKAKKLSRADEDTAQFEAAWAVYPRRPGASKKEAWQAWLARRRQGVDANLMLEGVKRYAAYIAASGESPKFIKHAATFFGPNEHYKADWSAPARLASKSHEKDLANTNYAQGIAQDGSF